MRYAVNFELKNSFGGEFNFTITIKDKILNEVVDGLIIDLDNIKFCLDEYKKQDLISEVGYFRITDNEVCYKAYQNISFNGSSVDEIVLTIKDDFIESLTMYKTDIKKVEILFNI